MFRKISNWFKKYFIPHEYNDHKPHILRGKATVLILGIIILIEAIFLVQVFVLFPNVNFFSEILECVLVKETNSDRLADNLPALKVNPLLSGAAQAKAEDMAKKGYFSHTSPEGVTPWYWISRVGYQYTYAGENLAINFSDSKDVVDAWMNSAGHRANILNGNFTEIGIGIAKGIYQNRETVFIVQMFGKPAQAVASTMPQPVVLKSLQPADNLTDQNQTFIAVKNAGEPEVLPVETTGLKTLSKENNSLSTLVARFVAEPGNRTNYLYLIILAVISAALILSILFKVKTRHPRIILNGIILIFIINAVLIINQYFLNVNSKIF